MPKVPTYDSFQATPNTLPQTYAKLPDFPLDPGATGKAVGNALTNAGDALSKVAIDMAEQANQIRYDDATNQGRELARKLQFDKDLGYVNLRGRDALDRPNGQSLTDEYGEKLQKGLNQISESLGNDAQKSAFARWSGGFQTGFRADVDRHFIQESTTYGLSVAEGIQKGAMDDIALNWNNPAAVNDAVTRIQAETYRQARLQGKSAEWQDAHSKALTSTAHKLALSIALENNDPAYAEEYLKRYSTQMNADDILAVKGRITKDMNNKVGMAVATDVIQKAQSTIQIGDGERAFNIAINTESGGKQFDKSGKPLTSPKGAIGIAQLMPETAIEAAKLAGEAWDENRYKTEADYNKALGLAYFQKQVQDNGGDLAKAYAAYNAGPGALKGAVKQSAKDGGNWLDYLPKETQNYVTANLKAYGNGDGKPPRATFEDLDAQIRKDPRIGGNPDRYKTARDNAKVMFEEQTQAIKQRDEEAVARAMKAVMQNGGRFSDLPSDIRNAIPAKEVDTVMSFAQKMAKGDDTSSMWLYSKLATDPTKDPYTGQSMSDDAFFKYRRELSEADYKHFSDERAKRSGNAPGSNGPGELNSAAIKQNLDANLWQLKIDPTPKTDSDNERVGAIRKFVNDYFVAAQRETGKKFTDAEVAQHINSLFLKNQTIKGLLFGYSGSMMGIKVDDLPSGTKDELKKALKAAGNSSPTDGQIMEQYWLSQVTKR